MPPQEACVSSSVTLTCPPNYVVVITNAEYGVAQLNGSCSYSPGDCVANATSIAICATDTVRCLVYVSGKKLPQCNDQFASYVRVEYDCVPLSMNDSSKEYNVCQNGIDITSDQGILKSPGYPSQFQTTTAECFRTIQVPADKVIRLWLSDLYISGVGTDCANDHVYVVDSVQTYRHCGLKRYAYPYLCSSTIIIQYLVKTQLSIYRGMRMYFEIVDRSPNDNCSNPNGTVTPIQSTTPIITTTNSNIFTTVPVYITLGIASPVLSFQLCKGESYTLQCPSNYAVALRTNIFGVTQSDQCEPYDAIKHCVITTDPTFACRQTCTYQYTSNRIIPSCSNKIATYQYVEYQCIPTNTVLVSPNTPCPTDGSKIPIQINRNGRFRNYNYPNLKKMNCTYRFKTTPGDIMNFYALDISLNDYSPSCSSNKITFIEDGESQGSDFCEQRSYSLVYSSCSNELDVRYIVNDDSLLFSEGVELYIENQVRPSGWSCGKPLSTSASPITIQTTPANEPLPIWAQNLEVSPILSAQICLGTSQTLRCPGGSDYVLSIIESIYGETGTGSCEAPSTTHCQQGASLGLTCTQSCFIEYDIPRPLIQCGSQNADYISIDYECIPTRLPNGANPIDICASATTDTIAINSGMMISPQYPTLGAARTCTKRIETLPNKLWMVFIVDLFLEGTNDLDECNSSSLTIFDGNDRIVRCGLQQPELILVSCSNIVEFKFISTHQALGYRGFKVFFQTIDVPNDWACKPTGFITTTPRLPTTTSLLPPSSQIAAYGGTTNGTRRYCKFPFIYQGNPHANCLRTDPPSQDIREPWCSLTSNFDTDRQWGFCELGVTDSTLTDICRSQSQVLKCPPGYVIDIITADYAAKPDGNIGAGACIYDKDDCFQTDVSTVQTVCAGKPSCTASHFGKTLTSCQNRPSAYLHIDYNCLPNDIPDITTYNLCDSSSLPQTDTRRGFIISPNYPKTHNNFDCTFNLQTVKPNQDIYLYIVDMDLNSADLVGQGCTKDRLRITADNNIMEMCGRSYTNFLVKTCQASVSLQLIRSADAIGRGVKLYFEFRERSLDEICPVLITTSARPSTIPTIESSRPNYFPDPSPHIIKTLCYPDISSLFGANNFQCPQDYIIVIHQAFYGKVARCTYTPGDFTSKADIIYQTCSGKQACSISFMNPVTLPTCSNTTANYLFVDYQCLPTPPNVHLVEDLCLSQISGTTKRSGILASSSYPSYVHTQCNNVTLSTRENSNDYIYLYVLDLSIDKADLNTGECTNDYVLISYECNGQHYVQRMCGIRKTEFLFRTCTSTDKIVISYRLMSEQQDSLRGFALVYQFFNASEISSTTMITSASTPTSNKSTPWPTASYVSIRTTLRSTSSSSSTKLSGASTNPLVSTTTTLSSTSSSSSTKLSGASTNPLVSTTATLSSTLSWRSTTSSSTISMTITPTASTPSMRSMAIINYDLDHVLMFICTVFARFMF